MRSGKPRRRKVYPLWGRSMGSLYSEHITWLHRWRAGAKLLWLAGLGLVLLVFAQPAVQIALALGCALLYVSVAPAMRAVRRLLLMAVVGAALVAGFHWAMGHPQLAMGSGLRLVSMAVLGMALTVTTRSGDLVEVLEWVLAPLRHVGLQPDRIALQLGLMLRFVEHFFVQWKKLDDAYRLRTGRRGGWRLLAPLTVQMLQTARRVGDALFSRLGG